jgi:Arf-GAP/coiled-coil/ANK repeat/PH domain-containing protein
MSNAAFTDLEDSPIFRARASELEQGLDRVKDRAQKLIKDAAKYCKSIEGQHAATLSFADSLETFCGGTDEESMLTGPGAAAPSPPAPPPLQGTLHPPARVQLGPAHMEPCCAGGPMLVKFVQTLRELASFHELLRTQVELLLVSLLERALRGRLPLPARP